LVLSAPWARAEDTTTVGAASTPGLVIITLRGTQAGLEYRLFAGDDERPLVGCGEGCRVRLPQGRYRLQVAGPPGSDVRTSDKTVELRNDSVLRVDPPSSSSRSAGLGIGIAGASLLLVGSTLLFLGLPHPDETCVNAATGQSSCHSHGTNWAIWTGAGMMVAGAIMTPIGWVTFARNQKPRVEVTSGGRQPSDAGLWRLGPTRIGAGWGLGGTVGF
jgi:hypothetical protein